MHTPQIDWQTEPYISITGILFELQGQVLSVENAQKELGKYLREIKNHDK